ncbi:MAG: hypothetical protein GYA55_03965, partial [SAR324 cluster bacterium]|nr:hypothetical protein [SAR324 cluster bacterium]
MINPDQAKQIEAKMKRIIEEADVDSIVEGVTEGFYGDRFKTRPITATDGKTYEFVRADLPGRSTYEYFLKHDGHSVPCDAEALWDAIEEKV